jgi:SAM-dependent methyltransferase
MRRILNLGCGNKFLTPSEGDLIINHDRSKHRSEVDVAWDLNNLPWPWEDNAFDLVVASAILEHLRLNLVESLDEAWRIIAPGGIIHIKVPYWNADASHSDPTHYWFFSLGSFDQFDLRTKRGHDYAFYTERKWRIVQSPYLNKGKTSIITKLQARK